MGLLSYVTALTLVLGISAFAQKAGDLPTATFHGVIESVDHKKIVVDQEGNSMDFYITRKTRVFDGEKEIKASELKRGQQIQIEAIPHLDGTVDAVTVRLQKG
jgi:hypothetical protein